MNAKGAGFELGENKLVVGGILPTGLDIGPDGALYIADWIEGWETHGFGRIWKLDDKKGMANAGRQETKTLLAADFSKKKDDELGALLGNADMQIRLKSQFELVKRGADGEVVFKKALGQTNQLPRIHAIWGISQLARKEKKYAENIVPLLQDKDDEIRAQAAKWLGDIKYKEVGDKLIPLLKDPYARARFFAAEALGRIAYAPASRHIIAMLRENNDVDVYLRHAGSLALARIGNADPLILLAKDTSRALKIAAVVALRRMSHAGVSNFLSDADEFIVTEAARAINDDLSIPDALPALGNLLSTTNFTNEPLIRRCINANLRVGTDAALQNLLAYANNTGKPAAMRSEAIQTISTWAKPSVLDRVDGRLRGEVTRNAEDLKGKTGEALAALLKDRDSSVRMNAVKAVSHLKITQAGTALMALLKTDNEPAIRAESLKSLAAMGDAQISDAIKIAIADGDKIVRIAGIDLIPKLNISKDLMVSLLSDVINTKTTEEKQAALLTLGDLPVQNSQKVFDELLQKMSAGKLSPDIYLELSESIDSTHSNELATKFTSISSTLSPDSLHAAYAGTLNGGDPDEGRRIFFRNQAAQCIRCHSYDDRGGNAGPRLNGVAARLSREELLEALINPSARLSPGFGTVTLQMKDGKTVMGTLNGETNTTITVKLGENKNEVIRKDQIAKRTDAQSSMPDMKLVLSKKEIRDVMSWLAGLKEDK